jgi:hypothetical protein
MLGNLFQVVGKERKRGNDCAEHGNVGGNDPADVVDEATSEAAFDAIETLVHVMAEFIKSAVYFVESSVDGIESAINCSESSIDCVKSSIDCVKSSIDCSKS